MYILG
jgi:leucyl-tRNA synthetase